MSGHRRGRVREDARPAGASVNGVPVTCCPTGAAFVPADGLLVVSDLHLEKGAAFARRGMMLPPYDTDGTLALLEAAIARHTPSTVLCLGDSFHDREAADLMPVRNRERLASLMAGREWFWILGNHDPDPPSILGGDWGTEHSVGSLSFRHEPAPGCADGEIAGHLHPVARVSGRGGSVRAPCFATDGRRMVMPSFGVTTGGPNVLDRAFDGLLDRSAALAYAIGAAGVYPLRFSSLSRG